MFHLLVVLGISLALFFYWKKRAFIKVDAGQVAVVRNYFSLATRLLYQNDFINPMTEQTVKVTWHLPAEYASKHTRQRVFDRLPTNAVEHTFIVSVTFGPSIYYYKVNMSSVISDPIAAVRSRNLWVDLETRVADTIHSAVFHKVEGDGLDKHVLQLTRSVFANTFGLVIRSLTTTRLETLPANNSFGHSSFFVMARGPEKPFTLVHAPPTQETGIIQLLYQFVFKTLCPSHGATSEHTFDGVHRGAPRRESMRKQHVQFADEDIDDESEDEEKVSNASVQPPESQDFDNLLNQLDGLTRNVQQLKNRKMYESVNDSSVPPL